MGEAARNLRDALVECIDARDRDGAVASALDAVRGGSVTLTDLYDVLGTLMVDVGASWQAGQTEVWQEHYATATVRTIVEACQPLVRERADAFNGRAVVLATPPDEYHDLGLRMTADRFALAGWRVHLLGASVPVDELCAAVHELAADMVVLSASTHFHRVALHAYVDGLRAACPGVRVLVGGAAFAVEAGDWSAADILDPAAIPTLARELG